MLVVVVAVAIVRQAHQEVPVVVAQVVAQAHLLLELLIPEVVEVVLVTQQRTSGGFRIYTVTATSTTSETVTFS